MHYIFGHYIYKFGILVEISTINRICMKHQFLVKDSTKIDMFGAQSDFWPHFALFLSLA